MALRKVQDVFYADLIWEHTTHIAIPLINNLAPQNHAARLTLTPSKVHDGQQSNRLCYVYFTSKLPGGAILEERIILARKQIFLLASPDDNAHSTAQTSKTRANFGTA